MGSGEHSPAGFFISSVQNHDRRLGCHNSPCLWPFDTEVQEDNVLLNFKARSNFDWGTYAALLNKIYDEDLWFFKFSTTFESIKIQRLGRRLSACLASMRTRV